MKLITYYTAILFLVIAQFSFTQVGSAWGYKAPATNNNWQSVINGNGRLVAVASSGTFRVMTSDNDGITWTSRTPATTNNWQSVTFGNGLFVAVSNTGTGNRVMTSPNGINWTSQASAADESWTSVTFGNGFYVAVANSGTNGRVMTSPDGINWTLQTSSPSTQSWQSITYGSGLFVAVGVGTGNRIMYSNDNGLTWTTNATAGSSSLKSICYSGSKFVAVGNSGSTLTSFDGITWVKNNLVLPATINANSVTYSSLSSLFALVTTNSASITNVYTSPDGLAWTERISPYNAWQCVTQSQNGKLVAVSNSGTGNRVMVTCDLFVTNTPGTYNSFAVNHVDGKNYNYNSNNCENIGAIVDLTAGNTLGSTVFTSSLSSSINLSNPQGYIYGRRSFSVAPTSDGIQVDTLKLYITQEDFDNYNANSTGFLSLPTSGNNSDPNKQFIRIATVEAGVHTISGPLGNNLNWNGTYWVLSVPVTTLIGKNFYFTTMATCNGITVNNLQATSITTDAVTATWNSVVTVPSNGWYSIQYSVVGSGIWVDGGTANNNVTSKFRNGLLPGTNYELQIRRNCSSQSEGPWSASVLFTTLSSDCGAPMVFTSTVPAPTSITTNWTAFTGASYFEFEYKETSSGTWLNGGTTPGNSTSKTFSGLTDGVSYDFRGRTYCQSGTPSAWSTIETATTSPANACSLPPVLTPSAVNASNATLTWPSIAGAAWYEFRYSTVSASGPWTSGGTANAAATAKTFSGLTQNTTYYYEGRTYCSNGIPSAWGATQFTTITAVGCELPPVLTATTVLATTATITWPSIAGASYFEYRYKETVSGTWISAGTGVAAATSKTLTGLTAGTQYDFQARTFCANGLPSAWSSTLQFTTAMAMPLQPKPGSDVADDKAIDNSNIDVNVYPNPTSDLVNIETIFEEADAAILVKVIDMNGRIVLEMNTLSVEGKNAIQLRLENLNTGIYNLELYNNNELIDRSKVIKTN